MAARIRLDFDRSAARRLGGNIADDQARKVTRGTFNVSRLNAPFDTGRMKASGGMNVRRTVSTSRGTVSYRTDYATIVHEGSRPHLIRPRRAKALRFRVGGRVVYAKRVRHPGTRSQPWLWRALRFVGTGFGFRVRRTPASIVR